MWTEADKEIRGPDADVRFWDRYVHIRTTKLLLEFDGRKVPRRPAVRADAAQSQRKGAHVPFELLAGIAVKAGRYAKKSGASNALLRTDQLAWPFVPPAVLTLTRPPIVCPGLASYAAGIARTVVVNLLTTSF